MIEYKTCILTHEKLIDFFVIYFIVPQKIQLLAFVIEQKHMKVSIFHNVKRNIHVILHTSGQFLKKNENVIFQRF